MKVRHEYFIHSETINGKSQELNLYLSSPVRSLKNIKKNQNFKVSSIFSDEIDVGEDKLKIISTPSFEQNYMYHGEMHRYDSDERYEAFTEEDPELKFALEKMGSWAYVGEANLDEEAEEMRNAILSSPSSIFPSAEDMGLTFAHLALLRYGDEEDLNNYVILENKGLSKLKILDFMSYATSKLEESSSKGKLTNLKEIAKLYIKEKSVNEKDADNIVRLADLLSKTRKFTQDTIRLSEAGNGKFKL